MLSIDGTFLFILVSFVLFMFVMKQIYFAPLMAIKHERESLVENSNAASQDAASKQVALNAEFEAKLAEARQKAQAVIGAKRDTAKARAQEITTAARDQAVAFQEAQLAQLNDSKESVYEALRDERSAFAKTIVNRISQVTVDPEEPVAV